ncbi:Hypothetical protein GLP15_3497 [Giardia lamblia P15]|uniref:Uncharacterized protein n=1 Tax=Giardia intestinalis (strain P15) TaxID=658858 RepID=E1F0G6_GIAIA|nr:Hypothetical protein GLP15_3497 [Giardia lamblia P15]
MSPVTTELWGRAVHYVSDAHTNHILSRSNGYEGHHHKPPASVRALLQDISGLPRYSNYLFLEGTDSIITYGKISNLTRLYVPIINRPYSVVGPTNVATDRLGITDASFFNDTVRVSNSFGPRARGWKCASSPASDVAICICPALTFRKYLKQKGKDIKSLLEYLKATSSDSLLCFNTTTMELTYSLPLSSINSIGPCSDISAIPFEIAATYLYSFMDLAPASISSKNVGTFPSGASAALLTCCDSRIYLVITANYKVKHIQLFTVLQPVPNLFASSITALSVQLLSASNSNSEVPRLLLLASGPLALATPQPAIVGLLSGVKANMRPPPVVCVYIVQFAIDAGSMPHVTTSVSLIASSFMDLLNVAIQRGKGSLTQIPTPLRIVKNGKGPEIILAGQYRLFLKPLYLRRNGPTTTQVAREIAKSAVADVSGISVAASIDAKSITGTVASNLVPYRAEMVQAFGRNLWYFRHSFEGVSSCTKRSLLPDPRTLTVSARFLLTDWLLLIVYIIGLLVYSFYGILIKVLARTDKLTIRFSKRETRGSYAVPVCVHPLLFNRPGGAYHCLIFLSDESVIGAKTITFLLDQNCHSSAPDTGVKLLQLYLIDRSTLQLPKNTHITSLSTRPILLHSSFRTINYSEKLEYVCPQLLYIKQDQPGDQSAKDQLLSEMSEKVSSAIKCASNHLYESIGNFGYRKTHTLLDQATEQLAVKASSSYLYYSSVQRSSLNRTSSSVRSLHSTTMDSTFGAIDASTGTAPLLYLCMFSYSSNIFQLNIYAVDNGISCCYSLPISLEAIENNLKNRDTLPSFADAANYSELYQAGHLMEMVSQTISLNTKEVSTSVVTFHDSCADDTGDSDVDHTPEKKLEATVLNRSETCRSGRASRIRRSQMIERPLVICAGTCSRQSREDTVCGIGSYLIDYCDLANDPSKSVAPECQTPEKAAGHSSLRQPQPDSYRVLHLPIVRDDTPLSFSFTGSVAKTKSVLLPHNPGLCGCTTIEVLFNTKQSSRVAELLSLALAERTIFKYRSGTAYPQAEMFSFKPGSSNDTKAPGANIKQAIDLMNRYIRNGKLIVQLHDDTLSTSASQRTLFKLDASGSELALLSMLQTVATRDTSTFYQDFTTDSSSAINCYALEVMITWFAKGPVVAFNTLQKTSIIDLLANYHQFLALLYCIVRRTCRFICDTFVISYRRTVALHRFLSLVELMSVQVGLTRLLETCYKKSVLSTLETISLSTAFNDELLYEVEKLVKSQNIFVRYYDPHHSSDRAPFFVSYNSLLYYVRDFTNKDYSLPDSYEEPGLRKGSPEYVQHVNATSLFVATGLLSDIFGHDTPCLPGFLIFYLHLYLCPRQYDDANDVNLAIHQRLKNKATLSATEAVRIITNAAVYRALSQFINILITSKDIFISFDSFPDHLVSPNTGDMILLLKLWPLSRYMGYQNNSSSNLMRHLLTLNTATSILQNARDLSEFKSKQSSPDIDEQHTRLQKAFEDSVAHASSFVCRELADSLICAAFSSPTYTALLRQLSSKIETQATVADHAVPLRPSVDAVDCWADEDALDGEQAARHQTYAQAVKLSCKSDEIILASPTLSAFLDRETVHLSSDNATLQKALIEQLEYSGRYIGFFTSLYYFIGYSFRFDDFLSTDQSLSFVSTPVLGRCTPVTTLLKTTVLEEDAHSQITNAIQLSAVIVKCLIPRIERAIHEANEYTRAYISDLIDIRTKDGYVDGISILMRTVLNITELPLNDVGNKDMLRIAHVDANFRMYELFKQALEDSVIAKHLLENLQEELKQKDMLAVFTTPTLFAWKDFCSLPPSACIFTALAYFSLSSSVVSTIESVTWLGHYYTSAFATSLLSSVRPTGEAASLDLAELLQGPISNAYLIGDEISEAIDAILLSCINSQVSDDVFQDTVLVTILHGVLQTPYAMQALIAQYQYIKMVINTEHPSKLLLNKLLALLVGHTEKYLFTSFENNSPALPPFYPLYTHCGLGSHFSYDSFKPLIALLYMISLSEENVAKLTHAEQKDLYRCLIDCILTPNVRKSSTMTERIESITSLHGMAASGIVISPMSHLKLRVIQSIEKYTDVYRKMCSSFISNSSSAKVSLELEERTRSLLALTETGELFDGVDGPGILIEHALHFRAKAILSILGLKFDMFSLVLESLCHYLQETYNKELGPRLTGDDREELRPGTARLTNVESYKLIGDIATFSYELLDSISLEGSTHASALLRKHAASSAFKGLAAQIFFFADADILHTRVPLLLTSIKGASNSFDSLSSDLDPEVTKDLATALLGGDVIGRNIVSDWIDVYRMSFNYYWRRRNNALALTGNPYYPSCISRILASSVCLLLTKTSSSTEQRSSSDYESFLLYLLLTTAFFYVPVPAPLKATQSDVTFPNNYGVYEQLLYYSSTTPLPFVCNEPQTEGATLASVARSIVSKGSQSSSLYSSIRDLRASKRHDLYSYRNRFVANMIKESNTSKDDIASACTLSTLVTCCYVSLFLEYVHRRQFADSGSLPTPGDSIYRGLLSLVSTAPISNICDLKNPLHYMGVPIFLLAQLRLPFVDNLMIRLMRESWASEPIAALLYLSLSNSERLVTGLFLPNSTSYAQDLPGMTLLSLAVRLLGLEVTRADIFRQPMTTDAIRRLLVNAYTGQQSSKREATSLLSLRDLSDDSQTEYFHGLPYHLLLLPSQVSWAEITKAIKHVIAASTSIFPDSYLSDRLYCQTINRLSSHTGNTSCLLPKALSELADLISDPCWQDQQVQSTILSFLRDILSALLSICHGLLAPGVFYTTVTVILHAFSDRPSSVTGVSDLLNNLRAFSTDYLLLNYILRKHCSQSGESLEILLSLLSTFLSALSFSEDIRTAHRLADAFASNIVHGDPADHVYAQKIYSLYVVFAPPDKQCKTEFLLEVLKRLPACRKSWFIPWFTNKAIVPALDLSHDQVREVVRLAYTRNILSDSDSSTSSSLLEYLDLSSTVDISRIVTNMLTESSIVAKATSVLSAVQNFVTVSKSGAESLPVVSHAYCDILQGISWQIVSSEDVVILSNVLQTLMDLLLGIVPDLAKPYISAVLAGDSTLFVASFPAAHNLTAMPVSLSARRSVWKSMETKSPTPTSGPSIPGSTPQPNAWDVESDSDSTDGTHIANTRNLQSSRAPTTGSQPSQPHSKAGWDCNTDTTDDCTDADIAKNCWATDLTDTDYEAWSSNDDIPQSREVTDPFSTRAFYNVLQSGTPSLSDVSCRQAYIPMDAIESCAAMIRQAIRLRKTANHYVVLTKNYSLYLFKGLFTSLDNGIPPTARFALLNLDYESAIMIAKDFLVNAFAGEEASLIFPHLISHEARALISSQAQCDHHTLTSIGVFGMLNLSLIFQHLSEFILSSYVFCHRLPSDLPIFREDTIEFLRWVSANTSEIGIDSNCAITYCTVTVIDKEPDLALPLARTFLQGLKVYCSEEEKHMLVSEVVTKLPLKDSALVSSWLTVTALCLSSALSKSGSSDITRLAVIQNLVSETTSISSEHQLDMQATLQLLSKLQRILVQLLREFILSKLDHLANITAYLTNLSEDYLNSNREVLLLYIKVRYTSDTDLLKHKLLASIYKIDSVPVSNVDIISCFPPSCDTPSNNDYLQRSLIAISTTFSLSPSVTSQSQDSLFEFSLRMIALELVRSSTKLPLVHYLLFWEAAEALLSRQCSSSSFKKLLPKLEEDASNRDKFLLFYTAFYTTTLSAMNEYRDQVQDRLERLLQLTAILSKPILNLKTLCVLLEPNQYLESSVALPMVSLLGIGTRGGALLQKMQGTEFADTIRTLMAIREDIYKLNLYKPSAQLAGVFPPELDGICTGLLGVYVGICDNELGAKLAEKLGLSFASDFRPLAILRNIASKVM